MGVSSRRKWTKRAARFRTVKSQAEKGRLRSLFDGLSKRLAAAHRVLPGTSAEERRAQVVAWRRADQVGRQWARAVMQLTSPPAGRTPGTLATGERPWAWLSGYAKRVVGGHAGANLARTRRFNRSAIRSVRERLAARMA